MRVRGLLTIALLAVLLPATSCKSTTNGAPADAASSGPQSAASTQTAPSASIGARYTAASVTRTLYVFPEADSSVTPLYALVNGAQKTLDMTMYELVDTTFSADLVAACKRGVKVRVILDSSSSEKTANTPAYKQLNAATNCSAAWSNPAFTNTHEKSLVVDGTQVAILSLNLTSRYYASSRDFGLVENDPADVAAVEATFVADYNSTTSFSYKPGAGDDLIWSPTTATADLLGIINGATKTLLVENEEMSATNVVSALEAACKRKVTVQIALTDATSDETNYKALEKAGCGVHTYASTAALYVHAKVLIADYGLATQKVYMGSINFSTASMTRNRELGLYITDATDAKTLNTTLASDYAGATAFK
jgi:phosphatidylserine/phosphatidylglycerophosphate/cardiolipin synthase-like enzyme